MVILAIQGRITSQLLPFIQIQISILIYPNLALFNARFNYRYSPKGEVGLFDKCCTSVLTRPVIVIYPKSKKVDNSGAVVIICLA